VFRLSIFLSTLLAVVVLIITTHYTASASTTLDPQPVAATPTIHAVIPTVAEAPTSAASVPTQAVAHLPEMVPTTPTTLSIPSIKLTTKIIPVGVDSQGDMAVPSGSTNNVGWYDAGTLPGEYGSAVLDAHVFAAFKNLRYAKIGDDIYVTDANGTQRHFTVTDSRVYKLSDVPADLLFNKTGGQYLNLITCAGTYIPSIDTYDHRLIVYAQLVDN
jgi:LPXTG-site transpeptidase (sortase) family protein